MYLIRYPHRAYTSVPLPAPRVHTCAPSWRSAGQAPAAAATSLYPLSLFPLPRAAFSPALVARCTHTHTQTAGVREGQARLVFQAAASRARRRSVARERSIGGAVRAACLFTVYVLQAAREFDRFWPFFGIRIKWRLGYSRIIRYKNSGVVEEYTGLIGKVPVLPASKKRREKSAPVQWAGGTRAYDRYIGCCPNLK